MIYYRDVDVSVIWYYFFSQGTLDKASSLALPLELFYKNSHLASQTTWTYLEDELFIPLRPELYKDIRDSVSLSA